MPSAEPGRRAAIWRSGSGCWMGHGDPSAAGRPARRDGSPWRWPPSLRGNRRGPRAPDSEPLGWTAHPRIGRCSDSANPDRLGGPRGVNHADVDDLAHRQTGHQHVAVDEVGVKAPPVITGRCGGVGRTDGIEGEEFLIRLRGGLPCRCDRGPDGVRVQPRPVGTARLALASPAVAPASAGPDPLDVASLGPTIG